jgi:hypothetical protein
MLKTPKQLDREIAEILAKKRGPSRQRLPSEDIMEAAYSVFERPGGEDLALDEFREEVRGLLHISGSGIVSTSLDKAINALYRYIYGG